MRGDDGFDRLALGIAREIAGGDAAKHFAHLGRTGERVLVEVQAQRVAAAERRVILLHRLHADAARAVGSDQCVAAASVIGASFFAGVCEWLRRGR